MNIKISESLKHFNYLQSELDAVYHEASLKLGMSDSSMIILYTLCNEGGSCLLNDICILTCLSKQTINSKGNSSLKKLSQKLLILKIEFLTPGPLKQNSNILAPSKIMWLRLKKSLKIFNHLFIVLFESLMTQDHEHCQLPIILLKLEAYL